jgi:hypothetical protein
VLAQDRAIFTADDNRLDPDRQGRLAATRLCRTHPRHLDRPAAWSAR